MNTNEKLTWTGTIPSMSTLIKRPHLGACKFVALAILLTGCSDHDSQSETTSANASDSTPFVDPSDLLSPGEFEVDVMGHPPRYSELSLRLAAAMKRDPVWTQEFIRDTAQPGKPLPYHEKMELSREEYAELLELIEHQSVIKAGTAIVKVTRLSDGSLLLDGGKSLPELTGVEIDFAKNEVRTPHGVASERDDGDAKNALLGDWNGAQWKSKPSDDMASTSITVILGQLKASRRGLLVCDIQIPGNMRKRITQILNFDPQVGHKK